MNWIRENTDFRVLTQRDLRIEEGENEPDAVGVTKIG